MAPATEFGREVPETRRISMSDLQDARVTWIMYRQGTRGATAITLNSP